MDITPLLAKGRQIINRYGEGAFTVAGVAHTGSVIVLPEQTLAWSGDISEAGLAAIEGKGVELLLIGSGERMQLISPALRQHFRTRGVALEIMDTGAACRTFNVLLAEGRNVGAVLIAV